VTAERAVELLAKIAVGAFIFAVTGVLGVYWWAKVPPSRPKGLSVNAVWLWAPPVGLPAPKRGVWLSCWLEPGDGTCRCRTTDKHGRTLYEGPFRPYKQKSVSESELPISADQTQLHRLDQGVFVNDELVPLVYLKSGEVLIPEAQYEKGRKLLDASRKSQ